MSLPTNNQTIYSKSTDDVVVSRNGVKLTEKMSSIILDHKATPAELVSGVSSVPNTSLVVVEDAVQIATNTTNAILANSSTPIPAGVTAALAGKEDVSNKATTLTGANNTTYPTTQAVVDAIASISATGTNLTSTVTPTNVTINSDTGTDAIIPLATTTNAGLLAPAEKEFINSNHSAYNSTYGTITDTNPDGSVTNSQANWGYLSQAIPDVNAKFTFAADAQPGVTAGVNKYTDKAGLKSFLEVPTSLIYDAVAFLGTDNSNSSSNPVRFNPADATTVYNGSDNSRTITSLGLESKSATIAETLAVGTPATNKKLINKQDLDAFGNTKGRNLNIARATNTEDVAPTGVEFETPNDNDTALIYLGNGKVEAWNYAATTWSKAFVQSPVSLDGNHTNKVRTNSILGVQPTNADNGGVPVNGDTVTIFLADETVEQWAYTTSWALVKTTLPSVNDGRLYLRTTPPGTPSATTLAAIALPKLGDTCINQAVQNYGQAIDEYYTYDGSQWNLDHTRDPFQNYTDATIDGDGTNANPFKAVSTTYEIIASGLPNYSVANNNPGYGADVTGYQTNYIYNVKFNEQSDGQPITLDLGFGSLPLKKSNPDNALSDILANQIVQNKQYTVIFNQADNNFTLIGETDSCINVTQNASGLPNAVVPYTVLKNIPYDGQIVNVRFEEDSQGNDTIDVGFGSNPIRYTDQSATDQPILPLMIRKNSRYLLAWNAAEVFWNMLNYSPAPVPTNVSQLVNDTGFITAGNIVNKQDKTSVAVLSTVAGNATTSRKIRVTDQLLPPSDINVDDFFSVVPTKDATGKIILPTPSVLQDFPEGVMQVSGVNTLGAATQQTAIRPIDELPVVAADLTDSIVFLDGATDHRRTTLTQIKTLLSTPDEIVTVTVATMPVLPTATIAGATFVPNTPSSTTATYEITDNLTVIYAKYNGTQYISAPAPTTGTEFVLAGTSTDAFGNKTGAIARTGKVNIGATTTPLSTLEVTGSFARKWNAVTSSTVITATDLDFGFVVYPAAGATATINLPSPATALFREYLIQLGGDNDTTIVTLGTAAGNFRGLGHQGQTTFLLKHGAIRGVTVKSDGSNWQVTEYLEEKFTWTTKYLATSSGVTIFSTNTGGLTAGVVNPNVEVFQQLDGNYTGTITLNPNPTVTNISIWADNSAGFQTSITPTNTDLPYIVNMPSGQGNSIHFEWSDGLWRWRKTPVKNAPSNLSHYRSGNGTVLPDGLTDTTENISRLGKVGHGVLDASTLKGNLEIGGSTVIRQDTLVNATATATIPTTATDLDNGKSSIEITQTTTDAVLLFAGTNVAAMKGQKFTVINSDLSTNKVSYLGYDIYPNQTLEFTHNGRMWQIDEVGINSDVQLETAFTVLPTSTTALNSFSVVTNGIQSSTTSWVEVPGTSFVAPTATEYVVKYVAYSSCSGAINTPVVGNGFRIAAGSNIVTGSIQTTVPATGRVIPTSETLITNLAANQIDSYTKTVIVKAKAGDTIQLQMNSVIGSQIVYQTGTQNSRLEYAKIVNINGAVAKKQFAIRQSLVAGPNVINHNFGLATPFEVEVKVRSISGTTLSEVSMPITAQNTNSVVINAAVAITNARIIVTEA